MNKKIKMTVCYEMQRTYKNGAIEDTNSNPIICIDLEDAYQECRRDFNYFLHERKYNGHYKNIAKVVYVVECREVETEHSLPQKQLADFIAQSDDDSNLLELKYIEFDFEYEYSMYLDTNLRITNKVILELEKIINSDGYLYDGNSESSILFTEIKKHIDVDSPDFEEVYNEVYEHFEDNYSYVTNCLTGGEDLYFYNSKKYSFDTVEELEKNFGIGE